jgi:hypothetical protein
VAVAMLQSLRSNLVNRCNANPMVALSFTFMSLPLPPSSRTLLQHGHVAGCLCQRTRTIASNSSTDPSIPITTPTNVTSTNHAHAHNADNSSNDSDGGGTSKPWSAAPTPSSSSQSTMIRSRSRTRYSGNGHGHGHGNDNGNAGALINSNNTNNNVNVNRLEDNVRQYMKRNILGMEHKELEDEMVKMGLPKWRAETIFNCIIHSFHLCCICVYLTSLPSPSSLSPFHPFTLCINNGGADGCNV